MKANSTIFSIFKVLFKPVFKENSPIMSVKKTLLSFLNSEKYKENITGKTVFFLPR